MVLSQIPLANCRLCWKLARANESGMRIRWGIRTRFCTLFEAACWLPCSLVASNVEKAPVFQTIVRTSARLGPGMNFFSDWKTFSAAPSLSERMTWTSQPLPWLLANGCKVASDDILKGWVWWIILIVSYSYKEQFYPWLGLFLAERTDGPSQPRGLGDFPLMINILYMYLCYNCYNK